MDAMENKKQTQELLGHGLRYAFSLSHHQAQAEDLLQSAWLAIFKANGPLNKAYLFKTIRNLFINQYRRNTLAPMVPLDDFSEEGPDMGQQQHLDNVESDLDAVGTAMESLRAIEREAMYLFAVEGYTADEIAELLDTTRGTVLSLIHRSRKKIKTRLSQMEYKVMS